MIDLLNLALWLAGGGLVGLMYFNILRHSVDLMLSRQRRGPLFGGVLVLLRMVGLGGVLIIAASQGAGPLLAAAMGLLIGRFVLMQATA